MRNYSIKRGHDPDLPSLIKQYFSVEGDIYSGFEFEVDGIGTVFIKQDGKNVLIETTPSTKTEATYDLLKRWNKFLFDVTGRTTKERKKLWEKEAKKH